MNDVDKFIKIIGYLSFLGEDVVMVAKLNAGVSVKGAIAYQDNQDPDQFHYFPSAPRLTLEDQLEAFKVSYWGIGGEYYSKNPTTGAITSEVGASVSGQVIFDAANKQKQDLVSEISKVYGVPNPKLIPFMMVNTEVVPVFAQQTLGIGEDADAIFPKIIQVGSSAAYNVSNGAGRFAQLFANVVAQGGSTGVANPDFSLLIYGDVEFIGDPWRVEIEADLDQVWSFVREKFSASAQIGWFNLGGAEYENVMQDLQTNNIVKIKYIEGTVDNKDPGNQLFEQGKLLFEAINAEITAGEGLFKLQPLPEPPNPPAGGGSILPWSVSINGSYQSSFFKQKVHLKRELEYVGRVQRRMPSSLVLAVTCGPETEKYFFDLRSPSFPCITQAKMDAMNDRLKAEQQAQNQVVTAASADLDQGNIENEDFNMVMNYLQNNSLTEDVSQQNSGQIKLGYAGDRMSAYRSVFSTGIPDYIEVLRRARYSR
ncbi:hypothetical protein PZ897_06235 [Hoeflea sp. YIM 152468]|uniref:hypothetical protein n=1 Tax=Hoeflea sp. YIM 152468 TaxID=3031759 RepID=UPI0023DB4462|nr:hypothetical protein [Hoeflea sp. YIM 152468]MDF1607770.1 hypothetical protein [Hoeflea sp. YIM 152468]